MQKLEIKLKANSRMNDMSKDMDERLKKKVHKTINQQKKRDSLSEEGVESIFNDLWREETGDILGSIRRGEEGEVVNIEATVQRTITRLLGPEDHLYRLMENNLRPQTFEAQRKHIDVKGFWKRSVVGYTITDDDIERLQAISENIIQETKKFYTPTAPNVEREFTATDAEELFEDVLRRIDEINDDNFDTKNEYKVELLVHIEGIAVDGFKRMHETYCKENSPKALLEKKKRSYHDFFMIQMGQGDAAVKLCETVLKDMVLENTDNRLSCTELLSDLRDHRAEMFRDIKSVQSSIMVDLFKKNKFEEYLGYITKYDAYVANKMEIVSTEYFLISDRFKKLAQTQVETIIQAILIAVDKTVKSTCESDQFIKTFFSNMDGLKISQHVASAFEDLDVPDKEQFVEIVHDQLSDTVKEEIKKMISEWDVPRKLKEMNLADFLFREIVVCRARCPFCLVPCDAHSNGKTSGNHSATLHRPQGLGGYAHPASKKLKTEDCRLDITTRKTFRSAVTDEKSTPYKEYIKMYPDWTIRGDADPDIEKYLKWVFAQHNRKFADYRGANEASIPDEWYKYERHEIKRDIEKHYGVKVEEL